MDKYRLTFNIIESKSGLKSRDVFLAFMDKQYSEKTGWGFASLSLDNTKIFGTLLKTTLKYYQVWDAETNALKKQSYTLVKRINFILDIKLGTIVVEGGVKDMNDLKSALRKTLYNEFVYSATSQSLYSLLNNLESHNYLQSIEELVLIDFKANDIFIGKYVAKLTNQSITNSELSIYSDRISKFKVIIDIDDIPFCIIATSNNSFSVIGDEIAKLKFIDFLTKKNIDHA